MEEVKKKDSDQEHLLHIYVLV